MTTPDELFELAERAREADAVYCERLRVCTSASCLSGGSAAVKAALDEAVARRGLGERCQVKPVGCMGLCSAGPVVAVETLAGEGRAEHLVPHVQADEAAALVERIAKDLPPERSLSADMPFLARQQRIVTANCGRVDPNHIEDALAVGGYEALLHALHEMTPAEVLDEVHRSGLRGRGGAGYPTGLKWRTVAKAAGAQKYVICNADEGDPGAYMDRSVLESDPHRVIEGMAIGAYAVGASEGYIYVRAEYQLAIERLKNAIRQADRLGLLGSAMGGTSFRFHVEVRIGAGAYVCGEETALLASIEGGRGTPRPRPPYPAEAGLFGQPTLINNVETWANVPPIIKRGGDWFASIGTERSKGTKVFALTGKVLHNGLVEVPMGMPLRDLIFDLGGGIAGGAAFKAVQTGGPSGGCIPAEHLDAPVDYETLTELGSIMGSGGMIVMDEHTCMVDVAKFFMAFCRDESCGKCIPCRVGTVELHELLAALTNGTASERDLALLEELCDLVRHTSLCGLGQSAPNPVLSTLRYFRDEYREHLAGVCRAGVCNPSRGTADTKP